jgi:hypothetical protein
MNRVALEPLDAFTRWRLARDIRSYVHDRRLLVRETGLALVEGGGVDAELKWASAYAESVDPLTDGREELANAKAAFAREGGGGETAGAETEGSGVDREADPRPR